MHTLKIIAAGLALLGLCLLGGYVLGAEGSPAMAVAALVFVPIWFVGAAINLWIGVQRAGYPFRAEAPIFIVVFGVPAVVAAALWWLLR